MRWLGKWGLRLALVLVALFAVLLAPVAYVELACKGEETPQDYAAILAPEHHRAEARTLLTYPEWHIVHAYDDYAQVIKRGDPHDFGYVKAVRTYWSSLCALKKRAGRVDGATKQLVYVIGVSFSAELALKATYEETIGRVATWIRGPEFSPLDQLSALQAREYARFLQQTPWYKWNFAADVVAIDLSKTPRFRDRERRFALGLEFGAKAAYAKVIANAVANVGADELTLRMIVTGPQAAALSDNGAVTIIGTRAEGVEVEVPRYRALTDLLKTLSFLDVQIVEMAGNDDIMFTAISPNATHPDALFSFPRQGYGNYRHLFMLKTKALLATLRRFEDGALEVEHVHDY